MKNFKIILAAFLLITITSCEKEQLATHEETIMEALSEQNLAATSRGQKVDVCHKGKKVINVSINAVPAHQAHGDAVDMDGDGFFNIASGCGTEVDCDDTNYDPSNSCCTDIGDYKTVVLNGKTWLAENLAIEVPNSWYFDDDPANCVELGRLYTFESAQEACSLLGPDWKVPSRNQWDNMINAQGGFGINSSAYPKLIDGGSTGFDVVEGGRRSVNGNYFADISGIYWSRTSSGSFGNYFVFRQPSEISKFIGNKAVGFSCRCIKN